MYFETKRMIIRNFRDNDIDELVDYRSNELCFKYQRGQYRDRENLSRFIERTKEDKLFTDGDKRLAIAFKETDTLVGDMFLSIKNPTISIGYTISYKYHRQGLAFELLSALIPELHNKYPEYEIVACTDKANLPSKNLLLKLGFKDEGYEPKIESSIFSKYKIIEGGER